MAHPNGLFGVEAPEETPVGERHKRRGSVLPCGPRHDSSPEVLTEQLMPVADAEQGNAEVENLRSVLRRIRVVHTGGTAGEDDALRVRVTDLFDARIRGHDSGIHVQPSDPVRDQMRVLSSEVEDDEVIRSNHYTYPSSVCSASRQIVGSRRESNRSRIRDTDYTDISFTANRIASIRLFGLAIPLPAMSNAVPWSTEVRTMGRPRVMLTPRSKATSLAGMCPWS